MYSSVSDSPALDLDAGGVADSITFIVEEAPIREPGAC